jgi:hypothetical protein
MTPVCNGLRSQPGLPHRMGSRPDAPRCDFVWSQAKQLVAMTETIRDWSRKAENAELRPTLEGVVADLNAAIGALQWLSSR